MKKRILPIVLALALLCTTVAASVTLSAAATREATVTEINTENASAIPAAKDNLLSKASLVVGSAAKGSAALSVISDGIIYGVTTTDEAQKDMKVGFAQTDGTAYKADGTTEWSPAAIATSGGGWARAGYDLGAVASVDRVLLAGSPADDIACNRYVVYYEVYASNTKDTLFDSSNVVYTYENTTPSDCQLITFTKPIKAQFIGFKMVAGQWAQARITEMGVYASEAFDPYAQFVTGATTQSLDAVPTGVNLLAGLSSSGSNLASNTSRGKTTDGKWPGLNEKVSPKLDAQQNFQFNQWGMIIDANATLTDYYSDKEGKDGNKCSDITFDLGSSKTLGRFAVGSTAEGTGPSETEAAGMTLEQVEAYIVAHRQSYVRLHTGEFFVSDDKDTLYDDKNLVASWDYTAGGTVGHRQAITPLAAEYTLNAPVTGRYVGFRVYEGSGWGWSSQTRVGELAVYAAGSTPAGGNATGDEYGTTYVPLTDKSQLPDKPSLIGGKNAIDVSVASSSVTGAATDGKYQGLDETVGYKTTTDPGTLDKANDPVPGQQGVYFEYNKSDWNITEADATRTVYQYTDQPAGSHPEILCPITFDLGKTRAITDFVIASTTEPAPWRRGSAPANEQDLNTKLNDWDNQSYLYVGEVYVSDDKDTLYDATNRVMNYDFSGDRAKALRNIFTLKEEVKGRYVGFKFGIREKFIRVSELAVYGETPETNPGSKVEEITSANWETLIPPMKENLLDGMEWQATGKLADSGSAAIKTLVDGKMYGINSDDEKDIPSVSFTTNSGAVISPVTGLEVSTSDGWSNSAFQFKQTTIVEKVMIVGSGNDNQSFGGNRLNNRDVECLKIYVGDSITSLFDESNLAGAVDNSQTRYLGMMITLDKPVSGNYVGFRTSGGAYNQSRLTEVGAYGTVLQEGATTLTEENGWLTDYAGTNITKDVTALKTGTADKKYPISNLFDGVIYGVTSREDADKENKFCVNSTDGTVTNPATGAPIPKATGWAQFSLDLGDSANVSKFVIAGSGADSADYYPGGYDNRNLLYYEIYVSNVEGALFDKDNLVFSQDNTAAPALAQLVILPKMVNGRYIGVRTTAGFSSQARLGEFSAFGQLGQPEELTMGRNAKLLKAFQVDARGIDNKTAVDANGNPGKGNTGTFKGQRDIWKWENNPEVLTDGNPDTRCATTLGGAPNSDDNNILNYDTPWAVFIYYLGGETSISKVTLWSSDEPDYYISGVQYYASYAYDGLFKNENLLYTSGGEHYKEDGFGGYEVDYSYEVGKRAQEYTLTPEQAAKTYRYVAFVVTRPYRLHWSGDASAGYVKGWSLARITELSAQGHVTKQEEPIRSSFSAECSLGTVYLDVEPDNYDDRDFFNSIDHLDVKEEAIPAGVERNIENNWLTVDIDKVFHFTLVDKDGKPIDDGPNPREVQIRLYPETDHTQTAGVIRDGKIERIYNSYTRPDGLLRVGNNEYTDYGETTVNNHAKATLHSSDVKVVILRYNDLDTINKLNGVVSNTAVLDFTPTGVAGATDTAFPVLPVALIAGAVIAGVVTLVLIRRRKTAFRAEQ